MMKKTLITRAILSCLLAAPLSAAPARHPTYEPVPPPVSSSSKNLLLKATTTASGQWSDRAPSFAVDGKLNPLDHWACENLPVWHLVSLAAPAEIAEIAEIAAVRVWPYWGDGRIYQFKVEGSLDGKSWTMLGDMTANSITSTPDGHLFRFAPAKFQHLRTTFLSNSRGQGIGGHLVEIEAYASSPEVKLAGGIGSTDLRCPPAGSIENLAAPASGIDLTAWRGERVSAQVVLRSDAPQQALRFDPLVLKGKGTPLTATARFVRYTLADGKPQGDILDDARRLDLPVGTPPGTYTGTFTARSNSSQLDFPQRLEVLPATLPAPEKCSFHLDLWQHPDAVAHFHDVPLWSDAHLALLKPSMIRLAQAGQKTITTTLIHEAWGGQTYDRFGAMIEWRKKKDGTWSYDYSIFDRWVSFMSEQCGFGKARIHGYSMIPWSLSFRYYDEASAAYVDTVLQPGSKEYDDFWGSFLRDFKRHMKEKGWLERMRIGMDERPDHLMRGALAINHPSALTREMDDLSPSIQISGEFKPADLSARRAAGRKTTYYVCTSPPVPV